VLESILSDLMVETASHKFEVEQILMGFEHDTLYLASNPAVQELYKARSNSNAESTTEEVDVWTQLLEQQFVALAEINEAYAQIRFIDLEGNEVVRVDSDGESVHIVNKQELQYKGDRYYVEDTLLKAKGELYISQLDLNKEGVPPTLQIPLQPVIRYGTSVFDEGSGEQIGLIVLNIRADILLQFISETDDTNLKKGKHYFISEDGYYFLHPDISKQWGGQSDLNTGFSVHKEFSKDVTDLFKNNNGGAQFVPEINAAIAYQSVEVDAGEQQRRWVFFEIVPEDEALGVVTSTRNQLIIFILIFGIIAIIVALFISESLAHPIVRLKQMALALQNGNYLARAKITSKDEVGALAQAFNSLADTIIGAQSSLEEQVEHKTKELDQQLQLAKQTKLAVLNILEDTQVQTASLRQARSATINIMDDLEEEKNRLASAKAKDEAILSSIGDGLLAIDMKGGIILANDAARQILGYKTASLVGKAWSNVLVSIDEKGVRVPKNKSALAQALIKQERVSLVSRFVRKDKSTFPGAVTASPVVLENGVVGGIIVLRDITKEKEVDKVKTEFVSLASHQLRTPLSTINWYTEMLLAGDVGKLSKDQKVYIEEIYAGNQRMVSLVNSLLNVSRLELGTFSVDPKLMDVVEEIKMVIKEMAPQIKAKKLLVKTLFKHKASIQADPTLLRIILHNLVNNAVKYTPAKGSVMILLQMNKDMLQFDITDTGYGIPKRQHERVFEKLFRADNVREKDTEGTGLGLYIIKEIVEQIGGKIWFESVINKGTSFHVQIPKAGMKKRKGSKKLNAETDTHE